MRIARAHAGRVEALQDREHGIDFGQRRAELLGDLREIAGEVAGLVDQIDEILPDHAAGRIGDGERELLGQMIGERRLGGDEGFEIVVAVLAAAGAGAGPFGIAQRSIGVLRAPGAVPSPSSAGHRRGRRPRGHSFAASRASTAGSAQSAGGLLAGSSVRSFVRCSLSPGCARAADCARARSRHRRPGRDWRAAAA